MRGKLYLNATMLADVRKIVAACPDFVVAPDIQRALDEQDSQGIPIAADADDFPNRTYPFAGPTSE